jgi:hypothetical protein
MDDASDAARDAFSGMASALKNVSVPGLPNAIKEVRFGLVTFEDSIIFQAPVSADLATVQSQIAQNFNAEERGTDGAEGALLALNTALGIAKTGTPASGAVNVVVLVTDALGHDGSGSDHHRSGSQAAIAGTLADKAFKSFLLFTALPGNDNGNGSGDFDDQTGDLDTVEDQYRSIRDQWKVAQSAPAQEPGAHLADELDDPSVLSSRLPQQLAAMLRGCQN